MLIIYSALRLGGIETFFVRLAKKRYEMGLTTKILLELDKEYSNKELLEEAYKYSEIYFIKDLFWDVPLIRKKLLLLCPFKKRYINDIVLNIKQIHVANGYYALLANRIIEKTKIKVPLTVGFYHSKEFAYFKKRTPSFIKIQNDFVLKNINKHNLITFSDSVNNYFLKSHNICLDGSNIFRIGVIDKLSTQIFARKTIKTIKILSIGRIVNFKTYNFWMLEVVRNLLKKGISVEYHIYGDGPEFGKLKDLIDSYNLSKNIFLKGSVNYSQIKTIMISFDLFIGSGTSIVEASSLGIPSIVGIESTKEPLTYGFFSDVCMYDYNIDGLDLVKCSVEELILKYLKMDYKERYNLSKLHSESIKPFLMSTTVENFESLNGNCVHQKKLNLLNYIEHETDKLYHGVVAKFTRKHPLDVKYNLQ